MSPLITSIEFSPEMDSVRAVIDITLGELIDMDIEELNDYCDSLIREDYPNYNLLDISYSIANCDIENNVIGVEVFADLDEWL